MPSSSPSSTRCGCSARIWRSLNVPGSDSSALQIDVLGLGLLRRDQLPLRARWGSRRRPCRADPASLSGGDRRRRRAGRRPAARAATAYRSRRRAYGSFGHALAAVVRRRCTAVAGARAPARRSDSASASGGRLLVHGRGRGDVAAAEAGHLDDLDVGVVAVAAARARRCRSSPPRSQQDRSWQTRELDRRRRLRCGSAGRTRPAPRSRTAAGACRATAPRAPRGAASRAAPGSRSAPGSGSARGTCRPAPPHPGDAASPLRRSRRALPPCRRSIRDRAELELGDLARPGRSRRSSAGSPPPRGSGTG